MEIIIKLEIEPSFEPSRQYVLAKKQDLEGKTKYKIISKSYGFTTETIKKTRGITESEYEEIIKELQRIRIHLCPEITLGLDGETSRLKITQGFNSICLEWWGDLPKEWKNLEAALKLFDG